MIIYAFMVPHPPIAVPEIGRGEEEKIQPTLNSYRAVAEKIAELKPDTIVLTSPHATMYRDWFSVSAGENAYGDFGQFGRPDVSFNKTYDSDFTSELSDYCRSHNIPAGTEYEGDPTLDHGTLVPLYFIDKAYTKYKLVRIGLSGYPLPDHYRLGQAIQKISENLDRRVVFVASGDLSHCQRADGSYGYKVEGPEYDKKIMKTMGSGNFEELFEYDPVFLRKAMECGHRSFVIMAGALDGFNVTAEPLTHEATFGVGYGFAEFKVGGKNDSRHFLKNYQKKLLEASEKTNDSYIKLARQSVESWVKTHKKLALPDGLPAEMLDSRAGAFVSLHKYGELRGCIGTIAPTCSNIAEEIIANGISASSRDPRFPPVTVDELPYLTISVDILKTPERIDSPEELDVKKYGVICSTADGRKGLLLPNLEGVDTVEDQINIACQKGRIDPISDNVILHRFEVIRHE